jgi:hypothetical protein
MLPPPQTVSTYFQSRPVPPPSQSSRQTPVTASPVVASHLPTQKLGRFQAAPSTQAASPNLVVSTPNLTSSPADSANKLDALIMQRESRIARAKELQRQFQERKASIAQREKRLKDLCSTPATIQTRLDQNMSICVPADLQPASHNEEAPVNLALDEGCVTSQFGADIVVLDSAGEEPCLDEPECVVIEDNTKASRNNVSASTRGSSASTIKDRNNQVYFTAPSTQPVQHASVQHSDGTAFSPGAKGYLQKFAFSPRSLDRNPPTVSSQPLKEVCAPDGRMHATSSVSKPESPKRLKQAVLVHRNTADQFRFSVYLTHCIGITSCALMLVRLR